jgi:ring-1,2-phenylacetyl-CoA epoxidase subunit PaaE
MNEPAGLYKTIRIAGINEEIKDFKTLAFADDHNIAYKAGQYITLVYHSHNVEIRRSYSITSSPALNEPLSIGIKRIENGLFSRKLVDTAIVGDELITIGSGGRFILPDDIQNYKQIFFFAAGSGITPVYSLIKTALYAHPHLSLVLIYSNASPEKTAFLDALKDLEKKFPSRFHTEFLFSNIVALSRARLHRDLLLEFLAQYAFFYYKEILFYICGPESYMRMCTYTLQEHDVPKVNIKREDFAINAVRKRDASPPDKNERNVFIEFNGRKLSSS